MNMLMKQDRFWEIFWKSRSKNKGGGLVSELGWCWDTFGTIPQLKIIFWDEIFENCRQKMSKKRFLPYFDLWVDKSIF